MYPDNEVDDLDGAEAPTYGRAPRVVVWLVGLGLLVLVGFLALQRAPEETIGGAVPEFDLPLLSGGGSISSDDLEGKPLVLNFWASWCKPCREEAPLIESLWREYESQGVVILGVVSRDTEEEARAFVRELGLTYTMVRDPGSELYEKLEVFGLPQTIFVTADGRYLDQSVTDVTVLGAITEEELRSGIEALLGQASQ